MNVLITPFKRSEQNKTEAISPKKKRLAPISSPTSPQESLTDVTRKFLSNIQQNKSKKKKIKAIKMIKNFKQK